MCDFKVGDEVEHVGGYGVGGEYVHGTKDRGVILRVWLEGEYWRIWVSCRPIEPAGRDPLVWRKIQRRDLQAWLATENTIEGPVRPRVPA